MISHLINHSAVRIKLNFCSKSHPTFTFPDQKIVIIAWKRTITHPLSNTD